MDKINVVVSAPIDTYSGYGARARDVVKALLKLDKYDVKVLGQRWGNTRYGYLKDHNEDELSKFLLLLLIVKILLKRLYLKKLIIKLNKKKETLELLHQ